MTGELYRIPITCIDGKQTTLAEFHGLVLLMDRHGSVFGRFAPDMPPDDPTILAAIEGRLARP